jgi:hypothetical protein
MSHQTIEQRVRTPAGAAAAKREIEQQFSNFDEVHTRWDRNGWTVGFEDDVEYGVDIRFNDNKIETDSYGEDGSFSATTHFEDVAHGDHALREAVEEAIANLREAESEGDE